MNMKKSALALAIAGIAAAPMAQADVTMSGYIGIILGSSDADGAQLSMASDDSTLNVSASHEMNSGLTGYGNYRTDFGLSNGGGGDADNIHIGIKGGFGDLRIGEVPDASEYGQVAGDILADIGGEERGISYTGSFGAATVGVNFSPEGDNDKIGAGIKFSVGGFALGVGGASAGDDTRMSAGASFGFGGASIGLAYKDFDNERQTIGGKVGYSVGGVSLGLTYEAEAGDVNDGDSKLRFDAGYGLGGGVGISTRINVFTGGDNSGNADKTDYRVMITKSF